MFGLGIETSSFYEHPVIAFGATYKEVEDDWASFILKFEYILENVGFDSAKIQLETELYGTYDFLAIKRLWICRSLHGKVESRRERVN